LRVRLSILVKPALFRVIVSVILSPR